jgi:hypothetical protein
MRAHESEASSGGLQTVAALRSYALMEDVGGSGKARQLKLSDLALRILLDQRPDSNDRAAHIREAALAPNVAAEVYERWSDGLPSDSTLNHYLVLERKFNEGAALTAIKILKENQRFANLTGAPIESPTDEPEQDAVIESQTMKLPAVRVEAHGRSMSKSQDMKTEAANPRLQLRNKGLSIWLEFSSEPTKEVFQYLQKWAAFEAEQAPSAVVLQPSDPEPNPAAV